MDSDFLFIIELNHIYFSFSFSVLILLLISLGLRLVNTLRMDAYCVWGLIMLLFMNPVLYWSILILYFVCQKVPDMEAKKSESHMISAAAFVEGGIQEACAEACSICLEEFCESDPSVVTYQKIHSPSFFPAHAWESYRFS